MESIIYKNKDFQVLDIVGHSIFHDFIQEFVVKVSKIAENDIKIK